MADIQAQDLQNDLGGVIRRVEAGERLRVTFNGRPVAELVPLPRRPAWLPWDEFMQDSDEWRADAELALQLRALLPETTEDVLAR